MQPFFADADPQAILALVANFLQSECRPDFRLVEGRPTRPVGYRAKLVTYRPSPSDVPDRGRPAQELAIELFDIRLGKDAGGREAIVPGYGLAELWLRPAGPGRWLVQPEWRGPAGEPAHPALVAVTDYLRAFYHAGPGQAEAAPLQLLVENVPLEDVWEELEAVRFDSVEAGGWHLGFITGGTLPRDWSGDDLPRMVWRASRRGRATTIVGVFTRRVGDGSIGRPVDLLEVYADPKGDGTELGVKLLADTAAASALAGLPAAIALAVGKLPNDVAAVFERRWPGRVRVLGGGLPVEPAPAPAARQPGANETPHRRLEKSDRWDWIGEKVAEYEGWLSKGLTHEAASKKVRDTGGRPIPRKTLDTWRKRVKNQPSG